MRNSALYDAYRQATKDILLLTKRMLDEKKVKVFLVPRTTWVRTGEGIYSPQEKSEPAYSILAEESMQRGGQPESVKALLVELNREPAISRQLDQLVGTSFSAVRFSSARAVSIIATEILFQTDDTKFSEEIFDRYYEKVEADFHSPSIEIEKVCPVRALTVEEELVIGDGIKLVPLGEEQIAKFLASGMNIGQMVGDAVFHPATAAISLSKAYAKRLGTNVISGGDALGDDFLQGRLEARVMAALRLYRPGRILLSGSARLGNKSIFGLGIMGFQGPGATTHMSGDYQLGKTDAVPLTSLLAEITQAARHDQKAFLVAVRRFSSAGERSSTEDRIIDCLIAAEAIFLADGDAQELSYRLSHRAGSVMSTTPSEKREIFQKWRQAYRVRSQLVHGKEPTLPANADGTAVTLDAFASDVESLVRRAINQKIHLAKAKAVAIDKLSWDEYLF